MRSLNRILPGLVLLALVIGCGRVESQEAIPDEEIGLSKSDIHDTPVPDAVIRNASEPGDNPVLPRAYLGTPPLVPHGVAAFLPITRDQNACIDCHKLKEKISGEPTPIPVSHYLDLRNAPDTVKDDVVGARFNCIACHAPQTEAPSLVGSTFAREE